MKKPRIEDFDPNTVPSLGSPLDGYPSIEKPSSLHTDARTDTQVSQSVDRPVSQSVDQSTSRPTSQSTVVSIPTHSALNSNKIVSRPKAFYITERLNSRLDDAVKYFQDKHGIKKVDRSTIVNALLDNEENWSEATLDLLVSRVISLLTSRLTS
jgi:hypothetical protein